jgi:hypothetical protein
MAPPSDPYRLAVAQAQGAARRYARTGRVPEAEALAELAEITEGLDGSAVLAEAAGIILGCCRQEEERPAAERAAGLLRKAGAREALIAGWVEEGKRRVERANLPPFGSRVV